MLAITLLLGGCPKKDARDHLQQLRVACPLAFSPEAFGTLVSVDRAPSAPDSLTTRVHLSDESVTVDWYVVGEGELSDVLAHARADQSQWSEDKTGVALLIEDTTPSEQVVEMVVALQEAGFSELHFIGSSTQDLDIPAPPNPRYAEKVLAEAAQVAPEAKTTVWAQETSRVLGPCLPARRGFEAVAATAPDQKCEMLIHAMDYAIPRCPGLNAKKVATLVHLFMVPDWYPVTWTVQLDPEASPTLAEGTWSSLSQQTLELEGQAMWLVTELPEVHLGSLKKGEIKSVMMENLGRVRFCYEKALKENPDLKGEISVDFVIGRDGRVESAEVGESSLDHPEMEACVLEKVSGFEFPEPKGEGTVSVTYPFIFSPAD